MNRLNPFDKERRAAEQATQIANTKKHAEEKKKKGTRKAARKVSATRSKAFNALQSGMSESF